MGNVADHDKLLDNQNVTNSFLFRESTPVTKLRCDGHSDKILQCLAIVLHKIRHNYRGVSLGYWVGFNRIRVVLQFAIDLVL